MGFLKIASKGAASSSVGVEVGVRGGPTLEESPGCACKLSLSALGEVVLLPMDRGLEWRWLFSLSVQSRHSLEFTGYQEVPVQLGSCWPPMAFTSCLSCYFSSYHMNAAPEL